MRPSDENSPTSVETSAGRIELPAICRDAFMFAQVFSVDPGVARAALAIDSVEPALWRRKALALIFAIEYRSTTIGAYNEVGVAVLAKRAGSAAKAWRAVIRPRHEPNAGWFILQLPVTTEIARAAGYNIWGYPKYVTDIRTEFAKRGVRIELAGELAIEHRAGWEITLPAAPFPTLSLLGGRLIQTLIKAERRVRVGRGRTTMNVLGQDRTADTVRQLGLDREAPLVTLRTDALQAWLPAGRDVG
jgi:hypothetical protein